MVCEIYSKCNRRTDNTAECICPLCDHKEPYNPICGDNGKVYGSQCQLEKAACKQKKNIQVVSREACGESFNTAVILQDPFIHFRILNYYPTLFVEERTEIR